jgi:ankyrin repeat protein
MLQKASEKGYEEIVKLLLDAGVDVKSQDRSGRSALHLAASGGHTEIVKLLLNGKADVVMEDKFGNTPLQLALGESHDEVAELLADHLKAEAVAPRSQLNQRLARCNNV